VRARFHLLWILMAWLSPATLAVELAGCNDGSTGCCMVCPECACGNSCTSCATRCTLPKGCACGSNTALRAALVDDAVTGSMSMPPDGGKNDD